VATLSLCAIRLPAPNVCRNAMDLLGCQEAAVGYDVGVKPISKFKD
jgi:hypothetical protein